MRRISRKGFHAKAPGRQDLQGPISRQAATPLRNLQGQSHAKPPRREGPSGTNLTPSRHAAKEPSGTISRQAATPPRTFRDNSRQDATPLRIVLKRILGGMAPLREDSSEDTLGALAPWREDSSDQTLGGLAAWREDSSKQTLGGLAALREDSSEQTLATWRLCVRPSEQLLAAWREASLRVRRQDVAR